MNRKDHLAAIQNVITCMNEQKNPPFILKGGTALSLCYALNRFSEDIDLDAPSKLATTGRFIDEMKQICSSNGYAYRIPKDTPTTQRVYINYGDSSNPLKVEASYRRREIPSELVCIKNGIQVYTISELARLKASAYSSRDKIRDLYDVSFICTNYYDELDKSARDALRTALEYKDLEQLDYIVQTQSDGLIDIDTLETMFLESFDKLGLLIPNQSHSPLSMADAAKTYIAETSAPADDDKRSLRH